MAFKALIKHNLKELLPIKLVLIESYWQSATKFPHAQASYMIIEWVRYVLISYFIQSVFSFKAKWKLNNNYSNSNIQYNTNLLNILNKEIKNKPKYGFDLMSFLNENSDSITK